MSFTFGIMVHHQTLALQLRTFILAVRSLSIPASQYEIIIAGAMQLEANDHDFYDAQGDLVFVCSACEFSDKIRAIFETAAHEYVWVSHDYVIPLPSFYRGMRAFGRGAQWLAPGTFMDQHGREIEESVMRVRLFSSKDYLRGVSWLPGHDVTPIGGSEGGVCIESFCSEQHPTPTTAANSTDFARRTAITAALRSMIGDKFALVPRNMRLSPAAAAAAYVNGNVVILARTLGQCIPARSQLPWGASEDIDWGARLAQHYTPEENPFIGVQLLKPKVLDQDAASSEQLRVWLLAEGLGSIIAPFEALPPVFWCSSMLGCAHDSYPKRTRAFVLKSGFSKYFFRLGGLFVVIFCVYFCVFVAAQARSFAEHPADAGRLTLLLFSCTE